MTNTEKAEEQNMRSFSHWLTTVEGGELHADLSRELQEAVAAMNNARAEGVHKPRASISLTLNLTLDSRMVEVMPKITQKHPELPRGKSIYFATPDNNLSRKDPQQRELPLKNVESTSVKVIDV